LAYVNDNFDKVVSDIGDLGAKFSTGVTGSCTVAANNWFAFTVAIQDTIGIYVKNKFPIGPRLDIAVDTNDADHYLPDGDSVTVAQGLTVVNVRVSKTSRNNFATEKATYFVTIHNFDVSSHTYYISADTFYQQSANQTGVFR